MTSARIQLRDMINGEMQWKSGNINNPLRLQGGFVTITGQTCRTEMCVCLWSSFLMEHYLKLMLVRGEKKSLQKRREEATDLSVHIAANIQTLLRPSFHNAGVSLPLN